MGTTHSYGLPGLANAIVTIGNTPRMVADILADRATIRNWGAVCDGVTDDTAAVQAALNAAGSFAAPPIGPNTESGISLTDSVPSNTGQGTVWFPVGVQVRISKALDVPPGVTLDLCGSTLIQTTPGEQAVKSVFRNSVLGYYGASKTCITNGVLRGPGWNVSTTYGLWVDGTSGASEFSKLVIWGFRYGMRYEGEYNDVYQVDCSGNAIGLYVSLSPTGTVGQPIDTTFYRCRFSRNAVFGAWIENGQNLKFAKCDPLRV